MKSIQIPQAGCIKTRAYYDPTCDEGSLPKKNNDEIMAKATELYEDKIYGSVGEALFNLDLGGGAYSCARCHTKGWSYGDPQATGGGAFGPNLTGGSSVRQFPNQSDMINFIKNGSELGKRYGEQGQGSGRMPAFGQLYTDEQLKLIVQYVRGL
jgi:mono/diheme cytochrome c family protein